MWRKWFKVPGLLILDLYIIRKFLGTFFFAVGILMLIVIVFDLSEKLDEFMEKEAPIRAIIFDYFLNFIPYFAALIAPLFTFIAVIFFTSRMAYNTEIIAILSSGVSFNRLLLPYFIASLIIAGLNVYLNLYVIPHANKERFKFEEVYYRDRVKTFSDRNVHKQIEPGVFVFLESFSTSNNYGRKFSIEKFKDGELKSKMMAQDIRWDTTKNKWIIRNYMIRDYIDGEQVITTGTRLDTILPLTAEEFRRRDNAIEAMDKYELDEFIQNQSMQGASVEKLQVEKNRRLVDPFSTFILMLIGVSVSSRKVRGGIGMHIALGLLMSASYLVFQKFSAQFAYSGMLSPTWAVWTPNIVFASVAFFLYRSAPK